jgi:hypothetical protein
MQMIKYLSIFLIIALFGIANAQEYPKVKLQIFDTLDMNNPLEKNNQSFVYYDTTHSYEFKFNYLKNHSIIVPDSLYYTIWMYSRGFTRSYQIGSKLSINDALKMICNARLKKQYDLFLSIDSIYINGEPIKQIEIIGAKYFVAIPRNDCFIYFNTLTELKNNIKKSNYKSMIYTNKNKPVFVIKYKSKTAPNTQ